MSTSTALTRDFETLRGQFQQASNTCPGFQHVLTEWPGKGPPTPEVPVLPKFTGKSTFRRDFLPGPHELNDRYKKVHACAYWLVSHRGENS